MQLLGHVDEQGAGRAQHGSQTLYTDIRGVS